MLREPRRAPGLGRDALAPAALVLLAGLVVLLLRPAIPGDETRYLEILRESAGRWLLQLEGRPYADKPPLLFWLASAAQLAGVPQELALRLIPAVASAAAVIAVASLGRRLGLAWAGWLQAAMLAPLLFAQFLLFDPLLTACVWIAIWAWTGGRDSLATVAAAGALLAKGPVALLFLIPLTWAVAALRPASARRRLILHVALAILPLAAWALVAGWSADADFRRQLLWERWAGRVQGSFAHRRNPLFYVPVLLVGALPALPLLMLGESVREAVDGQERFLRRLRAALLIVLVAFTLISGKQPHYLLPILPVFALLGAWKLEHDPRAGRCLSKTVLLEQLLLLASFATLLALEPRILARYGPYADRLRASVAWDVLLLAGGLAILAALGTRWAGARSTRATLAGACAAALGLAVPIHYAAGQLALPREIAGALREAPRTTSLAVLGGTQDGLFRWLADRDDIERLGTVEQADAWCRAHPGGLIVVDERNVAAIAGLPLAQEAEDRVRGRPCRLLRVVGGSASVALPSTEPD